MLAAKCLLHRLLAHQETPRPEHLQAVSSDFVALRSSSQLGGWGRSTSPGLHPDGLGTHLPRGVGTEGAEMERAEGVAGSLGASVAWELKEGAVHSWRGISLQRSTLKMKSCSLL